MIAPNSVTPLKTSFRLATCNGSSLGWNNVGDRHNIVDQNLQGGGPSQFQQRRPANSDQADRHHTDNRSPRSPVDINTISGGFTARGTSRAAQKRGHDDPLVITVKLNNKKVRRLFVDQDSSSDIIFQDLFEKMEFRDRDLLPCDGQLVGFSGQGITPRGYVEIWMTVKKNYNKTYRITDRMKE
ncbi:unnamed protein product [Lupinus luteus]|uniref:Uncharacterized protein n=1 Tax=Lupinus luteus TaxID=3873 RepID=A0AAV1VSD0_LUPLU